jgi:hypothetical protein
MEKEWRQGGGQAPAPPLWIHPWQGWHMLGAGEGIQKSGG